MGSQANLTLRKIGTGGFRYEGVAIDTLVIAGWTGRNQEALEKHIRELEELGVPRPKTTPIFYRVAAPLLTTADEIQVSGENTSGEAETVMFRLGDGLWFGLGSDHTDRKAETIGVSLSKQLCAKPVAPEVWRFDDIRPHWEKLVLRSWAWIGGARVLYQEGAVAAMRTPEDLMQRYGGLAPGSAMFCGTLAVHGGIRPAQEFELELDDPVLTRSIRHKYRIAPLPVEG
ncbi:MAG: DUF2848 domain-containing protein [Rhodospirillaceae bacterium]|nr:DUF2848 domain-containing protein [Rhodospirillaceae bacterium]